MDFKMSSGGWGGSQLGAIIGGSFRLYQSNIRFVPVKTMAEN